MSTKSISTSTAHSTCDVCGRTLLRGETPAVFLAGGSRRNVCELCTPRAAHEGWIREGVGAEATPGEPDASKGGSAKSKRR